MHTSSGPLACSGPPGDDAADRNEAAATSAKGAQTNDVSILYPPAKGGIISSH
jgi:hypothetical protein